MKQNITAVILCLALALSGCAQGQAPETEPAQSVEVQNSQSGRIDDTIKENHQIHATLYNPDSIQCTVYQIETIPTDLPGFAQILLPGDSSDYTLEHDEDYGDDSYITESGYTIRAGGVGVYLFHTDNPGKYDEIGRLNELYAAEHPDETLQDLDFMTLREAVGLGKKTIQDLGINLELVTTCALGLHHERLDSYQQELLERDKTMEIPDYDPFGKAYSMEALTTEDDCYYLKFNTAVDEIPVYGYPGEAAAATRDGVFSPLNVEMNMVISRNGFEQVEIQCPYRITDSVRTIKTLSPQEALALYKNEWSQTLLPAEDTYMEVQHIYLEYIPREVDGLLQLVPYWVFSYREKFENTANGQTEWWPYQGADRFHAETGENYAFGG